MGLGSCAHFPLSALRSTQLYVPHRAHTVLATYTISEELNFCPPLYLGATQKNEKIRTCFRDLSTNKLIASVNPPNRLQDYPLEFFRSIILVLAAIRTQPSSSQHLTVSNPHIPFGHQEVPRCQYAANSLQHRARHKTSSASFARKNCP
jgi:hypothetical protein